MELKSAHSFGDTKSWDAKAVSMYDFLDGLPMLFAILTLVVIGLVVVIARAADSSLSDEATTETNKGVRTIFSIFEHIAAFLFFVELVTRMYCYKVKFNGILSFVCDCRDKQKTLFNWVDIFCVIIDLVMYAVQILAGGGGSSNMKAAKSLRMLRLARLFRVLKVAKVIQKAVEELEEDEEDTWQLPLRYRHKIKIKGFNIF